MKYCSTRSSVLLILYQIMHKIYIVFWNEGFDKLVHNTDHCAQGRSQRGVGFRHPSPLNIFLVTALTVRDGLVAEKQSLVVRGWGCQRWRHRPVLVCTRRWLGGSVRRPHGGRRWCTRNWCSGRVRSCRWPSGLEL